MADSVKEMLCATEPGPEDDTDGAGKKEQRGSVLTFYEEVRPTKAIELILPHLSVWLERPAGFGARLSFENRRADGTEFVPAVNPASLMTFMMRPLQRARLYQLLFTSQCSDLYERIQRSKKLTAGDSDGTVADDVGVAGGAGPSIALLRNGSGGDDDKAHQDRGFARWDDEKMGEQELERFLFQDLFRERLVPNVAPVKGMNVMGQVGGQVAKVGQVVDLSKDLSKGAAKKLGGAAKKLDLRKARGAARAKAAEEREKKEKLAREQQKKEKQEQKKLQSKKQGQWSGKEAEGKDGEEGRGSSEDESSESDDEGVARAKRCDVITQSMLMQQQAAAVMHQRESDPFTKAERAKALREQFDAFRQAQQRRRGAPILQHS